MRCTPCTGRARSRRRNGHACASRSRSCSCSSSASRAPRARARATVATALGEPGELLARYRAALPFELTEHQERAIAEIDADLARHGSDAAPPAGRRGLGQDGRCALRASARRRTTTPGCADGADRDARRATLPHDRGAVCAARRSRRAADELREERSRRGAGRRHARVDPGRHRAAAARGGRDRRAASLRRRAAQGARRGAVAARAAHDGDADPANARADGVRRPLGDRDREAAGRTQADRHAAASRRNDRRRRTCGCAATSTTDGRRTSFAR